MLVVYQTVAAHEDPLITLICLANHPEQVLGIFSAASITRRVSNHQNTQKPFSHISVNPPVGKDCLIKSPIARYAILCRAEIDRVFAGNLCMPQISPSPGLPCTNMHPHEAQLPFVRHASLSGQQRDITLPTIPMLCVPNAFYPAREPQTTCGAPFPLTGRCLPSLRLLPCHVLPSRSTESSYEEKTPGI